MPMFELFLFNIFDSFICCGAYMIFNSWFGKEDWYNDITKWYLKPLMTCATCMASVWGGGVYLYFYGFHYQMFASMLAVAFLNSFFMKLYWKIYE